MEYSEADINRAKKIIELHILKYGVERTANLLKNIGNLEFWKEYKEFRTKTSKDLNDDGTFISLDDYDEDNSLKVSNKEAKVLWDIFIKYPEVQAFLADSVKEVDYDVMEIATRSTTINLLIYMLELLDEVHFEKSANCSKLYEEVSNKISYLNNTDFFLVYTNVIANNFFDNPKFEQVIKDKINSMSKSEYIYFLLTSQEYIDINNKPLVETIKNVNEKFDDPFINKVYESLLYIDLPRAMISDNKLDNVSKLIRGIDNKEDALKTLLSLNETEFMSYVLYYANSTKLLHQNIRNSKEFEERIKNLSRENLILLLEKYGDIYYYILENKEADVEATFLEYGNQWKSIFEEGIKRKLLTEDADVTYSEDDMFEAIEMDGIYNINKNIGIVPYFYATYDEYDKFIENGKEYKENKNDGFENDYDEEDDEKFDEEAEEAESLYEDEYEDINDFEEENDEENENYFELESLKKIYNELEKLFTFYDSIDKLHQVPDIKVLQMINHYNIKYKRDEVQDLPIFKKYEIRYLQSRIINMPIKYAAFYIVNKDGCLNSAMSLKTNELQSKVLKKPDDNLQEY